MISSCTSASDSERWSAVPIVNSPRRRARRWVAKCIRSQIASSIAAACSGSIRPGMRSVRPVALVERQTVRLAVDERLQIRMRKSVAQGQLGVELGLIAVGLASGPERHDHVGVAALGPDELRRVGLAPVELGQHLVGRVAAP